MLTCAEAGATRNTAPIATAANNLDFMSRSPRPLLLQVHGPVLADLRPWGRYTAPEMYESGGMAVVGKRLLEAGLLHPEEKTVTGRSLGEEIERAREPEGQDVIKLLDRPLKKEGGIAILRGNLTPGGCVMKVSGQTKRLHSGAARVFEREEDAFAAIKEGRIQPNDVMVLRNEGPKGGPGMREMQLVTGALQRPLAKREFPGQPALLTNELSARLIESFPGIDFNFSQYIQDNVQEAISGVKGENSIKLFGNDLQTLTTVADQIKATMKTVPGIADLAVFNSVGQPTIRIDIDRYTAGRYGLAPGDINAAVQTAIGGQVAGDAFEDGSDRHFPIVVRLAQPYRQSLEAIDRLTIGSQNPA
jgi:Dehydratase family/AcrB/AcrD/AcrF family